MSRLKFRAWDGEQMVSPDYVDRDGYAHWKANSIPEGTDRVMQWTGLLDKRGAEIFEGDILKFLGSGRNLISPVTFDSKGACIRDGKQINVRLDMLDPIPYEVIGNIWEHKEHNDLSTRL